MPVESYSYTDDGQIRSNLSQSEIKTAFESGEGLLWVNIAEVGESDEDFLQDTFHFHPLAIKDCTSPDIHRPKIDDFGTYLFIILHGINHSIETEVVSTAELAIFLGNHFVVSAHTYPLYSVESIRKLVIEDNRLMSRDADFFAHTLIDALIDNIVPMIDQMADRAEDIEEEIVSNPHPLTLDAIMKLKRSALRLHRVVAPQREVLNRLSRGEFSLICPEALIFYRDIYDHVLRIEDMNQSIRDRTSDAMSTYLSAVANRQNETMRVLSIVAAIFLPLTLLAGIYGMNFENMPELKWENGYFIVLGIIGTTIFIMLWIFWARDWIKLGRRQITRITPRPFKVEAEELLTYVGHLDHIWKWPLIPKPGQSGLKQKHQSGENHGTIENPKEDS